MDQTETTAIMDNADMDLKQVDNVEPDLDAEPSPVLEEQLKRVVHKRVAAKRMPRMPRRMTSQKRLPKERKAQVGNNNNKGKSSASHFRWVMMEKISFHNSQGLWES